MEIAPFCSTPKRATPSASSRGRRSLDATSSTGPFDTREEAHKYGLGLMQKFEDYTHISVVKIEVPHVQTVLGTMSLSAEKGP